MLWIKAFHIIAMVTWFAGLFYLPRLFVYHAMQPPPKDGERFKVMEHKLYYAITTPGAIVTILLGLMMLVPSWDAYKHMCWMHAKLGLVVLLVIYHAICGYYVSVFKKDRNTHTHIFYRWFNEVPTLFLIGIVILAVVKPF